MYHINFDSAIPIYEQVERQTKFLIANGALEEGAPIPSVRDASRTLTINPQTVVRAYNDLKREGLIYPLRGQGYFVAKGARERCARANLDLFQARFVEALEEAAQARLTSGELTQIATDALEFVIAKYYPSAAN